MLCNLQRMGKRFFFNDKKTQKAIIRSIEIIGEASKQISSGLKKKNQKIPWKQIAGMRDKLIHAYFGVSLPRVWSVCVNDVPALKLQIEGLLSSLENR